MVSAGDMSQLSDPEFMDELRRRIARERIPCTGSLEPTHRCNLKCVHCYLGDRRTHKASDGRELDTSEWLRMIDQMAEAQCLELLITGGEPLLRSDFAEIYTRARERGILTAVFTNATLVDDRMAALLADLPPTLVEASIYGASPETHDRVTGVHGSFERAMAGIRRLLERKVKTGLKTILMTLNVGEYAAMEKLAESMGCSWRLDSAVFPCLPGSDHRAPVPCCGVVAGDPSSRASERAPLDLRVDPSTAVDIECSTERRVTALRDAYQRFQKRGVSKHLYTCGAGLTGFHIDPYGFLQPCVLTPGYRCSALEHGFAAAWRAVGRVREVVAPADYECNRCDKQPICSGCPALFDLENGSAHIKSKYLCEVAGLRYTVMSTRGVMSGVPGR